MIPTPTRIKFPKLTGNCNSVNNSWKEILTRLASEKELWLNLTHERDWSNSQDFHSEFLSGRNQAKRNTRVDDEHFIGRSGQLLVLIIRSRNTPVHKCLFKNALGAEGRRSLLFFRSIASVNHCSLFNSNGWKAYRYCPCLRYNIQESMGIRSCGHCRKYKQMKWSKFPFLNTDISGAWFSLFGCYLFQHLKSIWINVQINKYIFKTFVLVVCYIKKKSNQIKMQTLFFYIRFLICCPFPMHPHRNRQNVIK